MKKSALIVVAILALIVVAAHYADKATRLQRTSSSVSAAKKDSPDAGKDAPDVTLKDLDGKDVSIAQYKGRIVLVNFWATWCEPCRVEIPWMIDFQHKYGRRGFTMLGVAMDDDGKKVVDPFIQKTQFDVDGRSMPMDYPIVLGNDEIA